LQIVIMTHGQVQQLSLVVMVLVSSFCSVPRLLLDLGWGFRGIESGQIYQGCTILWARLSWSLDCMVVPNVRGSSVLNLLHITPLAPRILRGLLNFWMHCAPNIYICGIVRSDNHSKTHIQYLLTSQVVYSA
jgi:hypothetical protein